MYCKSFSLKISYATAPAAALRKHAWLDFGEHTRVRAAHAASPTHPNLHPAIAKHLHSPDPPGPVDTHATFINGTSMSPIKSRKHAVSSRRQPSTAGMLTAATLFTGLR
jgi:hypothetical protein